MNRKAVAQVINPGPHRRTGTDAGGVAGPPENTENISINKRSPVQRHEEISYARTAYGLVTQLVVTSQRAKGAGV